MGTGRPPYSLDLHMHSCSVVCFIFFFLECHKFVHVTHAVSMVLNIIFAYTYVLVNRMHYTVLKTPEMSVYLDNHYQSSPLCNKMQHYYKCSKKKTMTFCH